MIKYLLIILMFYSTLFGNNLMGIDYGYIPSLSFHYNYNQSSMSGDTLLDYNKTYYNFPQIGLFYNYSLSNHIVLNISTEYYFKYISHSKNIDTISMPLDTAYRSLTNSKKANRIGIDIGIYYKHIFFNNAKLTIGPSLGYSLLWQSYLINYILDNPNINNNYSFSFYGSSPYIKICCYTLLNIYNNFGLRTGVDYVYSKSTYNNPSKTIYIPDSYSTSISVNGASICYENQFVIRIGLFYKL